MNLPRLLRILETTQRAWDAGRFPDEKYSFGADLAAALQEVRAALPAYHFWKEATVIPLNCPGELSTGIGPVPTVVPAPPPAPPAPEPLEDPFWSHFCPQGLVWRKYPAGLCSLCYPGMEPRPARGTPAAPPEEP